MAALDLETTGIDPCRDRVVSAAVVTISPGQPGQRRRVTPRTWLADPGIDIPVEATAIHGIATEEARREGRPAAEVIAEVIAYLGDVWTASTPLCVFNAAFDLTVLDAELQRHHGRRLVLGGPVIDPLCLDRHLEPHRSGKRTLSAMCAHYRVHLELAHNSVYDAPAAARLAWRLAKTQPARIGLVDPRVLHSHQARWYCEWQSAYAEQLERRIRRLIDRGGDTDEVARLRARAADARAGASAGSSWPLLPIITADAPPVRRRRPAPPGEPANSHASWTRDDDIALRQEWLTAGPGEAADTLRRDIASRYGRSPGAIRARLLHLRCDPELPGQSCDENRAAHLKRIYDAEYGPR